jgi:hypothetical protein
MDESREPRTAAGLELRSRVSAERWGRIVLQAEARTRVFEKIRSFLEKSGGSWRGAHASSGADVPWSTLLSWKKRCDEGEGELWERLLDERVPPDQTLSDSIRQAARLLRRVDRSINTEEARRLLIAEHGEEGQVSDRWLRRVWADAGLRHECKEPPGSRGSEVDDKAEESEVVEHFHGGAGLALIAAVDAQSGASRGLAQCVRGLAGRGAGETAGTSEVVDDGGPSDDRAYRDSLGRFTAAYNERQREGVARGETDWRWQPDAMKATRRPVSELQVCQTSRETLGEKLLAMGMVPLVTERRGFDGLDGPSGQWLGVAGGVAYMPATLDKALAELGLLGVDEALWQSHAAQWSQLSRGWSAPGPGWLETICYVDGTADPYWTRAFAKSGKVSRVGRVMPSLSRVALNSGAGLPLLVETHAGAMSLKKRLLPMLEELARAIGPDAAADRLTVVDSEAGTAGLLWALHNDADVYFISVIKGAVLAGSAPRQLGPWLPYRGRDELCEADVLLKGKGGPPKGLPLRAVQMRRSGGRQPQTTVFVTNAGTEDLTTEEVASLYLERWPRQEQTFRNARNGAGFNRSHGYGRAQVTHVALPEKLGRSAKRLTKSEAAIERLGTQRVDLAEALVQAPADVRKKALTLVDANIRKERKRHTRNQTQRDKLESMPTNIQERDTGRDSIMTCLKLAVVSLVQLLLKDYFGDLRMEWRTFIEQFVALPVTVRTTETRRLYQIHANPRQPERMTQLAEAIRRLNAAHIRRRDRLLAFELVEASRPG